MKPRPRLSTILAILFITSALHSQVPNTLNYQGRVAVGGINFNGTGQFKFALVNGGVDLSSTATAAALISGGEVSSIIVTFGGDGYTEPPAVTITGDGTGATATATLGQGMGTGTGPTDSVYQITVTNPGSGYMAVSVTVAPPPQNVLTTTYWSNDGTSVDGSQPTAHVEIPVTQGLYSVTLGDTQLQGMTSIPPNTFEGRPDVRLRVWFNDGTHDFQLLSPDQRLHPAPYAFMANAVADGSISSAKLANDAVGGEHIKTGTVTSSKLASAAVGPTALNTGAGVPNPGQLLSYTLEGLRWVNDQGWSLNGNAGTNLNTHFIGTTDSAHLSFRVNNQEVLRLEDDLIDVYAPGGFSLIPADRPMITRAYDAFNVTADSKYHGHGRWGMFMEAGQLVLGIPATDVGQRGFSIAAYNTSGTFTEMCHIDNNSGKFSVRGLNSEHAYLGGNGDGDVEFGSLSNGVTEATFWNPTRNQRLNIHARDASVRQLTIYGGADLAEPFAMSHENIEPGFVVVIDERNPGKLRVSQAAYDKKVAGIVSGADGIRPGISMTQEDKLEAGENVALSGRVYVKATNSAGDIQPGDLLTTSDTPGHAMKATDPSRTQGAVLGKAMSALNEDTGLVLVLVTLQ